MKFISTDPFVAPVKRAEDISAASSRPRSKKFSGDPYTTHDDDDNAHLFGAGSSAQGVFFHYEYYVWKQALRGAQKEI